MSRPRHTWRIMDRTLELGGRTIIMGAINVTPDSFSDGGLFRQAESAIEQGLKLWQEGADILDVGGESTRPGSDPTPVQEELDRVIPVIESLSRQCGALISVDTMKAEVAAQAIEAGAHIINDVAAFRADARLAPLAAETGAGVVLMHMRGMPKTMQDEPVYDDLVGEVGGFLAERAQACVDAGVEPERIVLDPGIGFGKTYPHNLKLIKHLDKFWPLNYPLLLGASRKAFIGHYTGRPDPKDRLWGTIGTHVTGAMLGAHIIRVHDVAPLKDAVIMSDAIMEA